MAQLLDGPGGRHTQFGDKVDISLLHIGDIVRIAKMTVLQVLAQRPDLAGVTPDQLREEKYTCPANRPARQDGVPSTPAPQRKPRNSVFFSLVSASQTRHTSFDTVRGRPLFPSPMRTCQQNDLTASIAAAHEPCRYEVLCLPFELPLLPPAKGPTCGQMHLPADPNRMLPSQTCVRMALELGLDLVHVHYKVSVNAHAQRLPLQMVTNSGNHLQSN